jgi:hypothetical protein
MFLALAISFDVILLVFLCFSFSKCFSWVSIVS